MTAGPAGSRLDVLVIGGGQAGLVMGHQLAQRGIGFRIVDAGAEVGDAWRARWDSLRLFTAAQYDSLPGMAFPAASDTYPGRTTWPTSSALTRASSAAGASERQSDVTQEERGRVPREGRWRLDGGKARGRGHRALPGPVRPAGRAGA